MPKDRLDNLSIENAHIMFRNFAGRADQYTRQGDRNFCVVIDDAEEALTLQNDGWNVKTLKPREEGDLPTYYINVSVSYNVAPPMIYLIAGRKKTVMSEDAIEALDYAEIRGVDLILNPYRWEVNKKTGIKAYLKTMYVTIEQDQFAGKYEDM